MHRELFRFKQLSLMLLCVWSFGIQSTYGQSDWRINQFGDDRFVLSSGKERVALELIAPPEVITFQVRARSNDDLTTELLIDGEHRFTVVLRDVHDLYEWSKDQDIDKSRFDRLIQKWFNVDAYDNLKNEHLSISQVVEKGQNKVLDDLLKQINTTPALMKEALGTAPPVLQFRDILLNYIIKTAQNHFSFCVERGKFSFYEAKEFQIYRGEGDEFDRTADCCLMQNSILEPVEPIVTWFSFFKQLEEVDRWARKDSIYAIREVSNRPYPNSWRLSFENNQLDIIPLSKDDDIKKFETSIIDGVHTIVDQDTARFDRWIIKYLKINNYEQINKTAIEAWPQGLINQLETSLGYYDFNPTLSLRHTVASMIIKATEKSKNNQKDAILLGERGGIVQVMQYGQQFLFRLNKKQLLNEWSSIANRTEAKKKNIRISKIVGVVLVILLVISLTLTLYFIGKRKGWFKSREKKVTEDVPAKLSKTSLEELLQRFGSLLDDKLKNISISSETSIKDEKQETESTASSIDDEKLRELDILDRIKRRIRDYELNTLGNKVYSKKEVSANELEGFIDKYLKGLDELQKSKDLVGSNDTAFHLVVQDLLSDKGRLEDFHDKITDKEGNPPPLVEELIRRKEAKPLLKGEALLEAFFSTFGEHGFKVKTIGALRLKEHFDRLLKKETPSLKTDEDRLAFFRGLIEEDKRIVADIARAYQEIEQAMKKGNPTNLKSVSAKVEEKLIQYRKDYPEIETVQKGISRYWRMSIGEVLVRSSVSLVKRLDAFYQNYDTVDIKLPANRARLITYLLTLGLRTREIVNYREASQDKGEMNDHVLTLDYLERIMEAHEVGNDPDEEQLLYQTPDGQKFSRDLVDEDKFAMVIYDLARDLNVQRLDTFLKGVYISQEDLKRKSE